MEGYGSIIGLRRDLKYYRPTEGYGSITGLWKDLKLLEAYCPRKIAKELQSNSGRSGRYSDGYILNSDTYNLICPS
jgi:hypothetical protein